MAADKGDATSNEGDQFGSVGDGEFCPGCGFDHSQVDSPHFRDRRDPSRVSRGSPGRRTDDYDPRVTISRKAIVITVVIVDAVYLAGEALLAGQSYCL